MPSGEVAAVEEFEATATNKGDTPSTIIKTSSATTFPVVDSVPPTVTFPVVDSVPPTVTFPVVEIV